MRKFLPICYICVTSVVFVTKGINVNPTSIIGDIGETVTFTCDGAGLEDATHYYWTVNGSVLMCSGCSSDLNIPGAVHILTRSASVLVFFTCIQYYVLQV